MENDEPTAGSSSAPRNLTAVSGDGQVTLIWDPPQSDGGHTITHYEVSCDNGETWVKLCPTVPYSYSQFHTIKESLPEARE
ncbi:MAG: fibronectin type III domain-containing protein [Clostridiales bacterium]|nr:fibronectin type III domain-containing protein [Clostridiales bacterium]